MIPYFPDYPSSVEVARGMIDGGTRYLEIQFPFSDPTADGPTIQGASAIALGNGFRIDEGWRFVAEIVEYIRHAAEGSERETPDVFVMSYASPVFARGVDAFVAAAADHGVTGLIVPDLPVDSDEGIYAAGRTRGVEIVPVISLGASPARIELVRSVGSRYIYAALRRGTTGAYTEIGPENIEFIRALASAGAKVVAGFGISSPEQVSAVVEYADAAVIGSAYVRAVESAKREDRSIYETVRSLTAEFAG
jgi:tryptophan synthase alpha chain